MNYNTKDTLNKLKKALAIIFLMALIGNFLNAEIVVEFDSVAVNDTDDQAILLSNSGDLPLAIYSLEMTAGNENFALIADSSYTIDAGEEVEIAVQFKPQVAGSFSDTLYIESNDEEKSETYIIIKGSSINNTTATEFSNNDVPDQFGLTQNYPNPFNPSTTFKIQVPESEQVDITIYSITGQKIKTIENRSMEPGYYTVNWRGTNSYGQEVSSGVYLARMQAGRFSKNVMLTYAK